MNYYGNVFRPPSESRSLIIQATIGCSHNKCTFCYMYKDEPFIVRKYEDIVRDLETIKSCFLKVLKGIYHHRIEYPKEKGKE